MFVALRRVHVAASDFTRSRRFYGETLGLPEVGGFERDWVEFGLGPILVKLTPLRPGEVPARNQVALVLSAAWRGEPLAKKTASVILGGRILSPITPTPFSKRGRRGRRSLSARGRPIPSPLPSRGDWSSVSWELGASSRLGWKPSRVSTCTSP